MAKTAAAPKKKNPDPVVWEEAIEQAARTELDMEDPSAFYENGEWSVTDDADLEGGVYCVLGDPESGFEFELDEEEDEDDEDGEDDEIETVEDEDEDDEDGEDEIEEDEIEEEDDGAPV